MQQICEASKEPHCILIVEDIEETRDGLERLLGADGYRVASARNEEEAVRQCAYEAAHLILLGIAGSARETIETARRTRERARLNAETPVVIFAVENIDEGEEVHVGQNLYMVKPDNFDQLRRFLKRLLATHSQRGTNRTP